MSGISPELSTEIGCGVVAGVWDHLNIDLRVRFVDLINKMLHFREKGDDGKGLVGFVSGAGLAAAGGKYGEHACQRQKTCDDPLGSHELSFLCV